MKKMYLLGALLFSGLSFGQIVISQVFGGGGNSGSTYKDDFIELHNNGGSDVALTNWKVQYASSTGPSATGNPTQKWTSITLPTYTIKANEYCTIKLSTGAGGTISIVPDIDLSSTTNTAPTPGPGITMGGTTGKVAISDQTQADLTGTNPSSGFIDLVGYGSGTNGFEGSVAPAPSSVNSIMRTNNTDTNNNGNDFIAVTANPNRGPQALLSKDKFDNIAGLQVYPNPAKANLFVTSNSFAEKTVTLYDVLGKQVLSTKVTNAPVNVASLNKGVYVVKVTEEGKTATRKVVIE